VWVVEAFNPIKSSGDEDKELEILAAKPGGDGGQPEGALLRMHAAIFNDLEKMTKMMKDANMAWYDCGDHSTRGVLNNLITSMGVSKLLPVERQKYASKLHRQRSRSRSPDRTSGGEDKDTYFIVVDTNAFHDQHRDQSIFTPDLHDHRKVVQTFKMLHKKESSLNIKLALPVATFKELDHHKTGAKGEGLKQSAIKSQDWLYHMRRSGFIVLQKESDEPRAMKGYDNDDRIRHYAQDLVNAKKKCIILTGDKGLATAAALTNKVDAYKIAQLQRFLFNLSQKTPPVDMPKGCQRRLLPADPDNLVNTPLSSWLKRLAMEDRSFAPPV
jgi:hypothetical protein